MTKSTVVFYLIIGFGLFFLAPTLEAVDPTLGQIGTFLIIGYWGLLGAGVCMALLKNLFADYGVGHMLYNIWLFLSLMGVAVGILALVDDGAAKSQWAVWLIVYGSMVGFLNRRQL